MSNWSRNFVPAQQGSLDGFCGIYSVINYLKRLSPEDDDLPARVFLRMLKAVQGVDELTPTRIAGCGFTVGQISRSAKKVFAQERVLSKIMRASTYHRKHDHGDVFAFANSLHFGEAAMVHLDQWHGDEIAHWVLLIPISKKMFCFDDSSDLAKPRTITTTNVDKYGIDFTKGLVFLNAQMH